MNEEFTPSAAPEVPPEPVPTQHPVLELPPDYEPEAPPVEVISVEELLERLAQEGTELEAPPEADPNEALANIPVEPDPLMLVLDQVIGKLIDVGIDLGNIEAHTRKIEKHTDMIQEQIAVVAQAVNHPALTTSFADYTVTEALLLFLLLAAFLSACARMLRGGLSWLRS